MLPVQKARLATFVALPLTILSAAEGHAASQQKKTDTAPLLRQAPDDREFEKYCANVAASINAARLAKQEKQIREAEGQLLQRRDELEAKRQELVQLIEKYDSLVRKADETIVALYAKMKPDVAAAQIAGLDDEVAASVLLQMKPKISSAILNEMDATRGAAVVKKLVGLSSLARTGKQQ